MAEERKPGKRKGMGPFPDERVRKFDPRTNTGDRRRIKNQLTRAKLDQKIDDLYFLDRDLDSVHSRADSFKNLRAGPVAPVSPEGEVFTNIFQSQELKDDFLRQASEEMAEISNRREKVAREIRGDLLKLRRGGSPFNPKPGVNVSENPDASAFELDEVIEMSEEMDRRQGMERRKFPPPRRSNIVKFGRVMKALSPFLVAGPLEALAFGLDAEEAGQGELTDAELRGRSMFENAARRRKRQLEEEEFRNILP